MKVLWPGAYIVSGILFASCASAANVTIDFGAPLGVISGWALTSAASSSSTGVPIPNPLLLHLGELEVSGTGGSVFCAAGTFPGRCGTAVGLTTGTAYGIGVGNGRVEGAETLVITLLDAHYHVKLLSFSLSGFSGAEAATYTIDGTPATVTAPVTNVALDTFTVTAGAGVEFTDSLVFSVPSGNTGNFSLSRLTLDVVHAPEPATFGLGGLALIGFGLTLRRKRRP